MRFAEHIGWLETLNILLTANFKDFLSVENSWEVKSNNTINSIIEIYYLRLGFHNYPVCFQP